MGEDIIQKTLQNKARIVLECPHVETIIPDIGASYVKCEHPKATYRGYAPERACVVYELMTRGSNCAPLFGEGFKCPLENSGGIERGYICRKI
ncbi:MAG: hypothetical protein V1900_02815 [Candidatus Aenigmatarchaeota archaeon]